ncbi:uncharacterized protein MKZ38_003274 [Zalerion maritima]|uniref:Geranylgeranyl transferase type-2 subunit alpha n=1 Tax=Zalerion maritima TaxID=339359 RepID=A0AAD5WRX2_9PEZI|nr:uncharacterized protein MKZ38_003274 [Zalerion maritima]
MASHGVARTTGPRTEERRKQDLQKIDKYRALEDGIREEVSNKTYSPKTFQLTTKLLELNPEYYTIWNARRRCLTSGLLSRPSASSSRSRGLSSGSPTNTSSTSYADALSSSSAATTPLDPAPRTTGRSGTTADEAAEDKKYSNEKENLEKDVGFLKEELVWTARLLKGFPKCYWIWNYRLWLLGEATKRFPVPTSRRIWENELALVSQMLTKDNRNFHAWGYRRFVVGALEREELGGKSMAESEFEYTTKMIHWSLSNFSAWHNRSKLIPRLLGERGADDKKRQKFLDAELDLVREALNVGPEDQSLWYYHQFLILNLINDVKQATIVPNITVEQKSEYVQREIDDIKDFLEDYDDIKWIYEALLEYTLALAKLESREATTSEKEDLKTWLTKLRELDPMRKGRWDDVEKEYGLN